MATAAQLTDRYRIDQAQTAGRTQAALALAFRTLLDPSRVDATFPAFLNAATVIIGSERDAAARLALAYYYAHRAALGVTAPYTPVYAGAINPAQVGTGLLVAGPVTVKQALLRGGTLEEAFSLALALTLGTAYRYAADGGRLSIQDTAEADETALGWARVTDGNPCYFCAMLASRGPVYKSERHALRRKDGRRYHNGCGCMAEPVYEYGQPWPGAGRKYEELWKSSTQGLRGNDAINAFRRAHEGRA